MSDKFEYPQFCALARAVELLGERWTLLVVRELLAGPKRFSDLLERLPNVSPSVLTDRLTRGEAAGWVRRVELGAPVRGAAYELTELGSGLRPVVLELTRWGARFLYPPRPGEAFEPEWLELVFAAHARRSGSPARAIAVRVRHAGREAVFHIVGGAGGTQVGAVRAQPDATLTGGPRELLAILSGAVEARDALTWGAVHVEGDAAALADLPRLFDVPRAPRRGV